MKGSKLNFQLKLVHIPSRIDMEYVKYMIHGPKFVVWDKSRLDGVFFNCKPMRSIRKYTYYDVYYVHKQYILFPIMDSESQFNAFKLDVVINLDRYRWINNYRDQFTFLFFYDSKSSSIKYEKQFYEFPG